MITKRRKVGNPLALAVLSCLREQPMHPYEMAATMRSRGKEQSIKLNYGSLYTVVDNLAKHGLIEAIGAQREGRRPERTVYRLTDAGRDELENWMAELIATPVKEYPWFEAALAELPALPPDQVLELLRDRLSALESDILRGGETLGAAQASLPRLVLVEMEYELAMKRAEFEWVRGLVTELEDGSFPGLEFWRRVHESDVPLGMAAQVLGAPVSGAPVSGGTAGGGTAGVRATGTQAAKDGRDTEDKEKQPD